MRCSLIHTVRDWLSLHVMTIIVQCNGSAQPQSGVIISSFLFCTYQTIIPLLPAGVMNH